MDKNAVLSGIDRNLGAAVEILSQLIQLPSTRGNEREISRYLKEQVEGLADSADLIPIPDSIMDAPYYSYRLPNLS